jgi:inner membrane protein
LPTFISHGVVAVAAGKLFAKNNSSKFWLLSIVCSILPDADALLFRFGVPYGNMFGHRGFSHSVLFAILAGLVVVVLGFPEIRSNAKNWWAFFSYFSLLGISHGILDAMTNGGLGVGFFIPFNSTRYFLPFRPIAVSPLGLRGLLSERGLHVMISEAFWIWLPAVIIVIFFRPSRKENRDRSPGREIDL